MKTYDWIVVGAGITGAALSYELRRQGFAVLLFEQHPILKGATRFGYGGLAFWSGTTALTRQLCDEGIALHRTLAMELEGATQFRELDLVLTIPVETDPQSLLPAYRGFAIPPTLVDVADACELEPLLNPAAIAGAFTVKHGHIHPEKTALAYRQAFTRLGGDIQIGQVAQLVRDDTLAVTGVRCGTETYHAANSAICAGALSRSLLKSAGIPVPLYFTHAELIETPPLDITLRTLVMPANTQRFELEAAASQPDRDYLWDSPGHEPAPPILDAGAIQFQDHSIRIGQISRTLTDLNTVTEPTNSEAELRRQVGTILPTLKDVPGTWHYCLIAFSRDRLPLIGAIPGVTGVHLFSGFSNPLVIVPPLARRFAAHATGKMDGAIDQLSPGRFVGS